MEDFLLISSAGDVLDAAEVRVAPEPQGSLIYADADALVDYGTEYGAKLESGGAVPLDDERLALYCVVDLDNGDVYETGAGWFVVPKPSDDDDLELDVPQRAGNYAQTAGEPAAVGEGVFSLPEPTFDSIMD